MRLRILGGLDLTSAAGAPAHDVTRQTRLILACLALAGAKGLTRAELCALFWPDRPSAQARNSLRQGLAAIRKVLAGDAGDTHAMSIHSDLESVRLSADPATVDVHAFRHGLQKDNRDGWIAAANAYRGELLDGVEVPDDVEHLVTSHRRGLNDQAQVIAERLSKVDDADGESLDAAQRLAESLLQSAAASEEAHRALMRVHLRRGRTNAALRQFEQCKEALRRELQAEPDLETRRLFGSIRRSGNGEQETVQQAESTGSNAANDARSHAGAASNIPIRVPMHFMGRDDALAVIAAALARHEGRVAITALHGLRGVGKTTLAAAYAELHRGEYRAIWWIRAQTEVGMCADLVALGVRLGWVAADDKEESALAAVMERLRHEGEGVLLIFDNAIDAGELRPYLPPGGGTRVLVTSNAHAWRGVAEPVEIQLWPKEIGADYLVARSGRENERTAAETLSEALGGLPLAHEQAAAYCERLGISLAEYHKRFEAAPARLLDDKRHAPPEYYDGLTVAKTFGLAIDEAAKLHPAAEALLVHAALLAPEPIPLFLFAETREKFGEPIATALMDDGLDEAMAALRTFALIHRETIADEHDPAIATETMRLHRLVREVAAARRDGGAREKALRALMEAVATAYPGAEVSTHPEAWPRARRLDALALALVDGNIKPPEEAEAWAAELLHRLTMYRHAAFAAYAQARSLEERAVAIRERVLGPEHADTAASLNELGHAMERQGHLAEARPLYERALAINEKVLGPENPATALNIYNLGRLLRMQGDLVRARSLHERAAALLEKTLGLEHFQTLLSLSNLAGLLQAQGDLAGARRLHERVLTIRERVLSPDHPHIARSLSTLAGCIQAQGDFAGARLLHERALAICEKALGPENPVTARSLEIFAMLLQEQGDFAVARPLHERALAIREKVLGSDHPTTAFCLNRLVSCVRAQGDLARARLLNEQALLICEKVLGPEHHATASSLSSRADLLHDQGDLVGARSLYTRALEIREKVLGPAHIATAQSLSNLATLLTDEGDLAKARTCYERALAIFETINPEHPNTNRVRRNFARLLMAIGRAAEALTFSEIALASHEKVLGKSHQWTRESAGTAVDALAALGRAEEAAALRQRYGLERDSVSSARE